MCVWHAVEQGEGRCLPDKERRVLVAQDDGYVEMAYWNGSDFEHDWPMPIIGSLKLDSLLKKPPRISRVRYWCDLPETPTEGGEAPF